MEKVRPWCGQPSAKEHNRTVLSLDRTIVNKRLKAKFHYSIWFEAGSKLVADLQRTDIWHGLLEAY